MNKMIEVTMVVSVFIVLVLLCILFYLGKDGIYNKYPKISASQVLGIKDKDSYFIYFYDQGCGYCKETEKDIEANFKDEKLKAYGKNALL